MILGKKLLMSLGLLSLLGISAHAQNLLIDGDFSDTPTGSGTPAGTITTQTGGAFSYDATSGAGVTQNGGLTTAVGGAGGWSFQNGGALAGSTPQDGSAIYVVKSSTSPDNWIAPAAASNTNGYVTQLDTISTLATWTTGNAIYQTVNGLTIGQEYAITLSVNTESSTGTGKDNKSAADLILANIDSPALAVNVTSTGGSQATITSTTAGNKNVAAYGGGGAGALGYQYQADTLGDPNAATALTWSTYTLDFTANDASILVGFADDPMSTNSNISLEDLSLTEVPEPRDWGLMMLLGAMGLIAVRKLRSSRRLVTASAVS